MTFTALVVGLLLSNVKASYDAFDNRLRTLAGSIIELDQRLRQYGDETAPIRANLRAYLAGAIADTWRYEPRPYGSIRSIPTRPRASNERRSAIF